MRLIVLCGAALMGLAVGDLSQLEPARLVLGGLLALLGAALAWRRPAARLLALVTCAAAVGGLRAALVTPTPEDTAALKPYLGRLVRLHGVVVQPARAGLAAAQLVVEVQAVGAAGRAPPPLTAPTGAVRARVVGDAATLGALASGDALEMEGRLLDAGEGAGPPTLLFPQLLSREPAPAFEPSAVLAGLRGRAQAGIVRYLPEPQASLAAGVLLGGQGRLDADFRLRMQRAGLAHVVAIDGFKQVVVAGALGALAVPLLGPRLAALPVLLGITAYTLLTGAHPAAIRAALMVGLATLAARTGRLADPLTSVLVAAVLMAAVEPRILLDVGLQLSLSATLGIVLLWPRLRPLFKRVPRVLAEPAGLTLAVSLATLPITLSVFQLVSLVSPLAHILAVPLLPLVLVSAAVLALVSPMPPVAAVVAWAAWLPSTLLAEVIHVCGDLPGAALSTGRVPPVAAGCLAIGLFAWGVWDLPELGVLRQRARWTGAQGSLGRGLRAPCACVAACGLVALVLQLVRPDGRLHVQTLVAGRAGGQAVFIRGPTGRTALVVGGRLDSVQLASRVADRLAVWEHRLGSVLQLDTAAQAGLGPTLARYPAEQRLQATDDDARVDLGGGAELDVHLVDGQPRADVAIAFGSVWLPLEGLAGEELVSDGAAIWTAEPAQPPLMAAVR